MASIAPNPNVKLDYTQDVVRLLPGARSEARVLAAFHVGADGPYTVEVPQEGFTADTLWSAINLRADEILKIRGNQK